LNLSIAREDIKTLVVKVGTTLLAGEKGFDGRVLEAVIKELIDLKTGNGMNILVVSSGAIGCGMDALGLTERPTSLPLKQATAAVGQAALMHYYEALFRAYGQGLKIAQVLLSASDLDNRQTYLNIRNTVHTLFELDTVIPIVNENDSVATDELKFGDNDTLAARVAAKIEADLLIILSDVDGLYDKNPATHFDAKLIEHVETVTSEVEGHAGDAGAETSVGGMVTKLEAAKIACSAGVRAVIANGHHPNIVHDILDGSARVTTFGAAPEAMPQRKRWIAFGRSARGSVQIDDGACKALRNRGKSLLAAGITGVTGRFAMGASVRITDAAGQDIARGLVNYSSEDLLRIKGCKSKDIEAILGSKDFDEVVHRDNLALL
jgi:glutamate 5-kinase